MRKRLLFGGLILAVFFGLELNARAGAGLGKLLEYQVVSDGVLVQFEQGKMKLSKLGEGILRVRATRDNFEPDHSFALWKQAPKPEALSVEKTQEGLIFKTALFWGKLITDGGRIEIYDSSGRLLLKEPEDGGVFFKGNKPGVIRQIFSREHFYGFGEKTGPFDKRGERMIMWNTDQIYNTHTDPIYQSHPYYLVMREGISYGIFQDNTYRSVFDVGASDEERLIYQADGGELNYYFLYGPSPKQVIERYASLVGRYPLPPLWAIGYQQCRYSYRNEAKVRRIAGKFRRFQIPCDVIYLDIHYLDDYKVFTFHPQRFPDPKGLLDDLEKMGFKTVAIVDPGVKIEPGYFVYEQGLKNDYFCRDKNGGYFQARVWPGEVYFPDFLRPEVRKWWGDLHQVLLDAGVDGIWNDMNEPAGWVKDIRLGSLMVSMGKPNWLEMVHGSRDNPVEHAKIHNVYALLEAQATYQGLARLRPGQRPFMITRAGYPGIQRYSAIWTGDNFANWEQLRMTQAMLLNMSLSGLIMIGADIGGFTGAPSGELYTRWLQQGIFYPFCRTHTAVYHPSQDPFSYGKKVREISKKVIELRYRLLPYTYSYFWQAYQKGLPVLRPLFLEFPEDERTYQISEQFMWGEWLLVAPVLKEGAQQITIYLPEGKWYWFESSEELKGAGKKVIPVELSSLPVLVREGAIIPLAPVMNYTWEKSWSPLSLEIYPSEKKTCFDYYEDDKFSPDYLKGKYYLARICQKGGAGGLELSREVLVQDYQVPARSLLIRIFSRSQPERVIFYQAGREQELPYNYIAKEKRLEIQIPDSGASFKVKIK